MIVREIRPDDAEVLAAVHVASWKDAYRGMMPDDYLDTLTAAGRLRWWQWRATTPVEGGAVFVAEDDDGAVRGFVTVMPHEQLGEGWAELPQIYLEPRAWGQGIGQALMTEALLLLTRLGFGHVELWVHPQNTRARRFYEAGGWTCDGTERSETVWGVDVPEVRYLYELRSA